MAERVRRRWRTSGSVRTQHIECNTVIAARSVRFGVAAALAPRTRTRTGARTHPHSQPSAVGPLAMLAVGFRQTQTRIRRFGYDRADANRAYPGHCRLAAPADRVPLGGAHRGLMWMMAAAPVHICRHRHTLTHIHNHINLNILCMPFGIAGTPETSW